MTEEQQAVVDAINDPSIDLVKVSACSGSGKTWTLQRLVDHVKPNNGLYLAYNKAIATEAAGKFPSSVVCKTTHSLAYQNTVKPFKLQIGHFGYRDIPYKLRYVDKLKLIDAIESFNLSAFTSFIEYCKINNDISPSVVSIGESLLRDMALGKLPCTHSFYLKLYHILLANGNIIHEPFDIILLDEAGDLNPVTLQIFLELPAKKKVLVGDPFQNIYSFNHTINGFVELSDQGKLLHLSQSFRVSEKIAKPVEKFMQEYLDSNAVFKGNKYTEYTINTEAYIARTNSKLIEKMFTLNRQGRQFRLTRSITSIFLLPRTLMLLAAGKKITVPEYSYLNHDMDDYNKSSSLQKQYPTRLGYIAAIHKDDIGIRTALTLLLEHGPSEISRLYTELRAEEHSNNSTLTLCTAHSSKGLEFDRVELANDFDTILTKAIDTKPSKRTNEQIEEFRLYYVAATRAKYELNGATFIDKFRITTP